MRPSTGRRMVLASMVITTIVLTVNYFKNKSKIKRQGFQIAWAIGALWLILSLGADTVPEIAGPLALLIMMGVLFFDEQSLGGIIKLAPGGDQPTSEPAPNENGGEEA